MYRRQSLWEQAQPMLEFASTVMSFGTTKFGSQSAFRHAGIPIGPGG